MRTQHQARNILPSPVKKKARPQLGIVRAPEPDRCPLCDGVIERFDREVFSLHDRCAPCHEALED